MEDYKEDLRNKHLQNTQIYAGVIATVAIA